VTDSRQTDSPDIVAAQGVSRQTDTTDSPAPTYSEAFRRRFGGRTRFEVSDAEFALWTQETNTVPPPSTAEVTLESGRVGAWAADEFMRMGRRQRGEEKPIPLPWPSVAALCGGGLWPGLTVLVGNTGSGKSQLALQVAVNAAQNGAPALYVGLELDRLGLLARLMSLLSPDPRTRPRWSDLYLGKIDPDPAWMETAPTLARLPFYLELGPPQGWPIASLRPLCEALRAKHPEGPFVVVLDFLQIVGGEADSLRERIGQAAYQGRAIARDLDAAVILISSTARENYNILLGKERGGKGGWKDAYPGLGDGNPARFVGLSKEAGEVEYSADGLWALTQRPWEGFRPPAGGTQTPLAIAKVRAGVGGWAELLFDGTAFAEARPTSSDYYAPGPPQDRRLPPEVDEDMFPGKRATL
jgi:hypothetical protein